MGSTTLLHPDHTTTTNYGHVYMKQYVIRGVLQSIFQHSRGCFACSPLAVPAPRCSKPTAVGAFSLYWLSRNVGENAPTRPGNYALTTVVRYFFCGGVRSTIGARPQPFGAYSNSVEVPTTTARCSWDRVSYLEFARKPGTVPVHGGNVPAQHPARRFFNRGLGTPAGTCIDWSTGLPYTTVSRNHLRSS